MPGEGNPAVPESAPPAPRPRWRRKRVWIPALLLAGLVVVPPWVIRARGRAALREVRARHAAAGLGTTVEDLVRTLPETDPGRQDAYRSFEHAVPYFDAGRIIQLDRRIGAWLAGGAPSPGEDARDLLGRDRPAMERIGALLGKGPLYVGVTGNLATAPPRESDPVLVLAAVPVGNLVAARSLGKWYRLEALFADDPEPARRTLDRLGDAVRRPSSLIDAMIALATLEERDRAYVELALAGRLAPEAEERWLEEEPEHLRILADGLRGERLLFLGALATALEADTLDARTLVGWWPPPPASRPLGRWNRTASLWLHGAEDVATVLDLVARQEAAFRGAGAPLGPGEADPPEDERHALRSMIQPQLSGLWAVRSRTSHRLARLFVRVLRLRGTHGRLPADDPELRSWLGERASLMDPGPLDDRLRYGIPVPGSFRVEVHPAGPFSPIGPGRTLSPGTRAPVPAGPPFRWEPEGIEIRFPADPTDTGTGE